MTPPPALAPEAPAPLARTVYLCHCLKVTHDEVHDTVDQIGCATVDEVTTHCGAGGGCTACHRKIRACLANRR